MFISSNLTLLYQKENFNIYKYDTGVLLVNTAMDNFAHTHINNLNTAVWLIELSLSKKMPRDIARYLLISLIRINNDDVYISKLSNFLNNKRKKSMYINRTYRH